MNDYQYPLDLDWTPEEMQQVIRLFVAVEEAYEGGIDREVFLQAYRAFKEVVPSKGEEKRYGGMFEKASGYSLYRVVQATKEPVRKVKVAQKNDGRKEGYHASKRHSEPC